MPKSGRRFPGYLVAVKLPAFCGKATDTLGTRLKKRIEDKKIHFQPFKDIWLWTQDLNHLSIKNDQTACENPEISV